MASRGGGPTARKGKERRRRSYVLLETVVATGLLIVGLAVVGAQVQESERALWAMERDMRALRLAEEHLAKLDLGLVLLESEDELQEGDFGPRHPDFGWRMIIQRTALEDMFLLKLEVLFHVREGLYRRDDFEFEEAESQVTLYALRASPRPLDFAADFGLRDDELLELSERFAAMGITGLDPSALDPTLLARLDFEELLEVLPAILGALGMDVSQLMQAVPPQLLEQLQSGGLLEDVLGPNDGDAGSRPPGGRRPSGGSP